MNMIAEVVRTVTTTTRSSIFYYRQFTEKEQEVFYEFFSRSS